MPRLKWLRPRDLIKTSSRRESLARRQVVDCRPELQEEEKQQMEAEVEDGGGAVEWDPTTKEVDVR